MVMSSTERGNSGGSGSCQDCGNKAKRDCEHMRCRTCCKSRGFNCPTHVRSTWVPVARRRQLLHNRLSLSGGHALPFAHSLRLASPGSSSGFRGRDHSFPAEINTVANFRCVRVTSDDNAVDQAAYQASVAIGGHLFKGILYDQGSCPTTSGDGGGGGGGDNSSSDHYLHHHQLVGMTGSTAHHGGGGSTSVGGGSNPPPYPYPHQYSFYPSTPPFNAFLPGMQFFPHPKP